MAGRTLLAELAIALAARLVSREAQRRRALEIVEAATIGIVLIDRDREVVALNAGIEKLFGRSREALRGKPIEALIRSCSVANARTGSRD